MADTTTTITGNITGDPVLRFTPSGKAVANFGVAVNRLVGKPGEDRKEEVSFFDISCWDSLAQNVADLPKGTRVVITGRLQQRSWETTPEDGAEPQKRSKVEIVAEEIGASLRWATVEVTKNEKRSASTDSAPVVDESGEPF